MILFKDDYVKKGWERVHPLTKQIVDAIARWSIQYDNQPITLTETLSTPARDKKLKRVSSSHSEGRAVDIRTRDMKKEKIMALMQIFSEKFGHLGYLSKSGQRRLMVHHDSGHGPHFHLAIGLDVMAKFKDKFPEWKPITHKES
jgi:uncharacterized protein YcbK (DUF882 family)